MKLENLNIKAEYEEYLDDELLWNGRAPCWITFDNSSQELCIKLELELDDDQPNTYIFYKGKQTNSSYPYVFKLTSDKHVKETMELKIVCDDGCWYFDGINTCVLDSGIEVREIHINQIDN